jgi:CBS domain-containing protein
LTSDCATELEGLGNIDAGTLLELGKPFSTLAGPDVALVTVLEFELLCLGVGHLDGFEIVDELDFLVEDLLVGVITAEQLRFYVYDVSRIPKKEGEVRTNETDTSVKEDFLLVMAFDILIVDWFVRLAVDPTDIQRPILQATVKVFDEAHKPGHLNTAFNGEFAASLHLPSCARATPRSDFAVTGDNDDLFQIDKTSEVRKIGKRGGRFKDREVEAEIRTRKNINGLKESLSFNSVDDLEVRRVITSDSAAKFSFFVQFRANAGGDVSEVGKAVHSTVEIGPDRFDLGDAEEERMHETKEVECHFFG